MSVDLPIENQSLLFQAIPGPKGHFLTGNLTQINFHLKVNNGKPSEK